MEYSPMFPSYPLDEEELSQEVRAGMSTLVHTTTLPFAFAILESRRIGGNDPTSQACFGVKHLPRVDLALYQEVSLYFDWLGAHEVMESGDWMDYAYWPCPPECETAYHVKTQETLAAGYWQSNVYKADKSLVFKEARLVAHQPQKYGNWQDHLPSALLSIVDSDYAEYKKRLELVAVLNSHQGRNISVCSDAFDWSVEPEVK